MRSNPWTGGVWALTLLVGCGDSGATSTGTATESATTGTTGGDTTGTPTTTEDPGTSETGSSTGDSVGGTTTSSTSEPGTDTSGDDTTPVTSSESSGSGSSGSSESGSESSTGAPLVCGDAIVSGDEACDDGNQIDGDECTNACTLAVCGDQVVQAGVEDCDDGMASKTCDADCTAAMCGDAQTNTAAGEACDDGNALDSDGCVKGCVAAKCGDGFLQVGVETCDDGNMVDADACSNTCKPGIPGLRPDVRVCGFYNNEIQSFFPDGFNFNVIDDCTPDAKTQAMFITRDKEFIDPVGLKAYLSAGGVVLTEYNISDEVFSMVFEPVNQGAGDGSCQDTAPTVVQFTPDDPLWKSVPFQAISLEQSGCGHDVGDFPGVTPLAGWSADKVGVAYRDLGLGRLYLTDFDWYDGEMIQDMTLTNKLMGYMMTHPK